MKTMSIPTQEPPQIDVAPIRRPSTPQQRHRRHKVRSLARARMRTRR